MLGVNCRSSSCPSPPPPHCQSGGAADNGFLNNMLNISPSLSSSSCVNPIIDIELDRRTLSDHGSLCWTNWDSDNPLPCSTTSLSSNDTLTTPKSIAKLKDEIARLELQIMNLERHLLCLYRTAFDAQISSTSLGFKKDNIPFLTKSTSNSESPNTLLHQNSPAHSWTTPYYHTPKPTPTTTTEQKVGDSSHRSLADHLGASCLVSNNLQSPDRLSQDIVRCISSIYCKLANNIPPDSTLSPSPTSSFSSSLTGLFSSENPCVSWSPQYNDDNHTRLRHGFNQDTGATGPYATMIQVLNIRLDNDTFNYAAKMLQHFRSLVRKLEKVDPRKMKREEKLVFWINIHNALVMHAYLAYGSRNRVRSASTFKAAYNVGGHCINAYVIQSSILGIRPHNQAPLQWLQTVLAAGRKSKAGSNRHDYALEYPEPLVHFALSSGEYFDPAVRAYTAKNIFGELKIAKEEFIEASVEYNYYIEKKQKQKQKQKQRKILMVPRAIYYFAKDMSMSIEEVLKVENDSYLLLLLGKRQIKPKTNGIHWLPHTCSTFRYLFHPHFAL